MATGPWSSQKWTRATQGYNAELELFLFCVSEAISGPRVCCPVKVVDAWLVRVNRINLIFCTGFFYLHWFTVASSANLAYEN